MVRSITIVSCCLVAILLSISSSAFAESDGPSVLDVDRSDWSEERRQIDDAAQGFLTDSPTLGEALQDGPEQVGVAAERKGKHQRKIEKRLTNYAGETEDSDGSAWDRFRTGQLYLNFACELLEAPVPDAVSSEAEGEFRSTLENLAMPLVDEAMEMFVDVRQKDVSPWTDSATFIVDEFDGKSDDASDAGDVSCDTTTDYWRTEWIDDSGDQDDRSAGDQESDESAESGVQPGTVDGYDVDDDDDMREMMGVDDDVEVVRGDDALGLRGEGAGSSNRETQHEEDDATEDSSSTSVMSLSVEGVDDCDAEGVEQTLERRSAALRQCYEHFHTDPGVKRDVTMVFRVGSDARPTDVMTSDSTLDHEAAETCLGEVVEGLEFSEPEAGKGCEIEAEMEFLSPVRD